MIGPLLGKLVVRRLALPPRARVVTVGGATFGGSGKTPLAIACAAELARRGARVALVGHAYRARPGRPRAVCLDDGLAEVGDEALVAARELASVGARVVVGPTRAEAIAFASREADVLVIDGVAQTSPVRASLALLAVDALEPWGRGREVPPRGTLRAPIEALVGACDLIVRVGDVDDSADEGARLVSRGAWVGRTLRTWDDLAAQRVGLVCALARPERVHRALVRRGVEPRVVVRGRDHGPLSRKALARAAQTRVDLWLATPKCALHVAAAAPDLPVATLDHALALPGALSRRLAAVAGVP